jgi:hypothetical protein
MSCGRLEPSLTMTGSTMVRSMNVRTSWMPVGVWSMMPLPALAKSPMCLERTLRFATHAPVHPIAMVGGCCGWGGVRLV